MRLTLRTMLAYMDDILEAEDAQDLGKKIEESDFAGNLMVRIRDVTRRLRLGAPNVGERGAMFDPNTVAEYLDNTLPGERVPDFEKVCLESDVHLAEVASCHQVLTMVLGEPAEIDADARQRMYQLPAIVAAQAKAPPEPPQPAPEPHGGDGAATGAKTAPPPRPSRAAVPDYLRESPARKRRFWPVAAALFLAGFLTVVVLAALGQFAPDKPLGRLLGISGPEQIAAGPDGSEGRTLQGEATPSPETPGAALKQPDGVKPTEPDQDGPKPAEKAPVPEDVVPATPETPPLPPGPSTSPKPGEKPVPELPAPPVEKPGPSKPDTVDVTAKPGMEKSGEKVESPAKPSEPAPAELLGRLLSDREVLLRFDPKEGAWMRIPAQGSISSGHELLALPTFRPIIGLSAGITIQLAGGTQVDLLPSGAEGPPGLQIVFGRALLSTVGKAGTQLRLQAGNMAGMLTFVDADSTAAVAVSRRHAPGSDPETQPDPVRIDIYARSGRVGWTAGDGSQPVVINSPGLLTLETGVAAPPAVVEKLPEWINSDTAGPLDRRASPELAQAISVERPVRIGLLELLDHRQREVRWLAARCLGYIGEYQLMVAGLNNPEERLVWSDFIDQFQEAVLRGPASAAAVRQTMERQFGQEGSALYRMLLGYTDDGLKAQDAAKLVGYLDHKDLAFRVLAFWNLKNITGLGLFYQPEATEAKRKQSVAKWHERLASGAIVRNREAAAPAKSTETGPATKPVPGVPPAAKPVVPEEPPLPPNP